MPSAESLLRRSESRDPFDLTACEFHTERESGPWRLERRTVEPSPLSLMRGGPPAGTYTGLLCNGSVWMTDTPDEKRQHYSAYLEASRRGGRCLVHGLGLGMVVKAMLDLPNVEHVDVVEVNPYVIDLAGPAFDRYGDRLTIHEADCFEKTWTPGTRWSVVWHDIWRDICADNLEDMKRLHRKFGRRSDWQASWSRPEIEYRLRRERRHAWF